MPEKPTVSGRHHPPTYSRHPRPCPGIYRQDSYVTLEKGSRIFVNRAAARLLGQPERVVLLYDIQCRTVGIRSAEGEPPDSDKKIFQTGGRSSRASVNSFAVSAIAFSQRYNLTSTRSRQYAAEITEKP